MEIRFPPTQRDPADAKRDRGEDSTRALSRAPVGNHGH